MARLLALPVYRVVLWPKSQALQYHKINVLLEDLQSRIHLIGDKFSPDFPFLHVHRDNVVLHFAEKTSINQLDNRTKIHLHSASTLDLL
jgi:hypothetical protein